VSPRATYRMQFHKGFTFADGAALAPYLARLGISHLYSSPILAARAGSLHGYDVIDHARINPELGGEDGLRLLAEALARHGIGIVLDIVPNHMAVGGADNPCWLDLLEKGRDSVFADLFDIDWDQEQPNLRDKVFVPLLGKKLQEALGAGEIALIFDDRLGRYAFAYAEHRFPLRREDYAEVEQGLEHYRDAQALSELLGRQNFRLAYWRDAGERINWRRFFDITELAALRVEDDGAFELIHGAVFRLYAEGLIDGVRIDHVDGLADPRRYCRKLRARLEVLSMQRPRKGEPYVVVEKILAADEALPADWGVDGTTGYDFMDQVSALQHDGANAERFAQRWSALSGRSAEFDAEERAARREVLENAFAGALRAAAQSFHLLQPNIAAAEFERALAVIFENFHAYRTYATGDALEPAAGPAFDAAVADAKASSPGETAAIEAIDDAMRGAFGEGGREAARRFNQLAAPVAAKAVEDTAFYRYGRLLSRNDVGFSPSRFAISADAFLARMAARQARFPCAMLATATHDHKRGEDVRARLAALSEVPELWEAAVAEWFAFNARLRPKDVTAGDEYMLYQTLVGAWPLDRPAEPGEFRERILQWREKSLREAKLQTSWFSPNAGFEKANADFVSAILAPAHGFVERLAGFVDRLAPAGAMNSLVQTALRCTAPGVPDLYQGAELWDFSLVDPDNRRVVDYALRRDLARAEATPASLLSRWRSGAVKLKLIQALLALRAQAPALFTAPLVPIQTPTNMLAFRREADGSGLLVAVARHCARACIESEMPLPRAAFWQGQGLAVEGRWRNALDPARPPISSLDGATLFRELPVAVLIA